MTSGMEEKSASSKCIKNTRGPWIVKKITKDGQVVTNLRFPSEKERQNHRETERRRRSITRKIFSGLRSYGNYPLTKRAHTIDLLKALCEEAGWQVEEDGTISRKGIISSSSKMDSDQAFANAPPN